MGSHFQACKDVFAEVDAACEQDLALLRNMASKSATSVYGRFMSNATTLRAAGRYDLGTVAGCVELVDDIFEFKRIVIGTRGLRFSMEQHQYFAAFVAAHLVRVCGRLLDRVYERTQLRYHLPRPSCIFAVISGRRRGKSVSLCVAAAALVTLLPEFVCFIFNTSEGLASQNLQQIIDCVESATVNAQGVWKMLASRFPVPEIKRFSKPTGAYFHRKEYAKAGEIRSFPSLTGNAKVPYYLRFPSRFILLFFYGLAAAAAFNVG